MLDPKDRVAMVSGAARGIGRAIVERLLDTGWRVSAGVREARGLVDGERLLVHRFDAESSDSAETWLAATLARFGALHGLVNAAGINPMARLSDADERALDAMWLVNVKAPMRLIRLALPHLKACGEGRVINIASLSGKRVKNANTGYAISKFALMALTQAVRQDGWGDGVRATALCPGFVATGMTAGVTAWPRERMTDPRDLAVLAETVMRLPNTATVAELLVNCRFEEML
jgi:NAD(P)-dependent dehydrogenase (short-subunit alcohol dehydrogenase family)